MKKNFVLISFCTFCLALAGCGSQPPEASSQAFGTAAAPSGETAAVLTSTAETQTPTTSPATAAAPESSAEENQTENASVFEILPESFYFSSGAGAWASELRIAVDGSFTGEYQDTDMGDSGEGYPNGTVYICRFSGKFSTPEPVDDFSFSMRLESLNMDGTPGDISYEDGVRYVYSEPYGLDNPGEFLLYLPGRQLSRTSEAFISWSHIDTSVWDVIPPNYYGIYNVNAETAFIGIVPENPQ